MKDLTFKTLSKHEEKSFNTIQNMRQNSLKPGEDYFTMRRNTLKNRGITVALTENTCF